MANPDRALNLMPEPGSLTTSFQGLEQMNNFLRFLQDNREMIYEWAMRLEGRFDRKLHLARLEPEVVTTRMTSPDYSASSKNVR
jgi:hypothetical protein